MAERKLRPIYDAIDARNYKQSLKLCNAFLSKKDNQNQIVTALKALTLEKQGKKEEAEQLCAQVGQQTPTDETVLNTLFLVYKALGKLDEVSKLYENAYSKNPKSEDLLLGVFCSYVRRQEYLKQKEVTLRLQKSFPKDKYLMWMIQSTVLQVPPSDSANPLLQLAEKMFEQKIIQENKVKNLEGLQLYLGILAQQRKYGKMLEVVSGKLGDWYKLPEERIAAQAELHLKLSQFEEAMQLYTKLSAEHDCDNWSYYVAAFDASEKLLGKGLSVDQFVADAHRLIVQLQQKSPEKRGPFLAELELAARAEKIEGKQNLWGKLEPVLVSYFAKFSSKFCCFSDIKPYLGHVPKDCVAGFCDKLQATIAQPTEEDPKMRVTSLLQFTSLEQVRRFLGLHDQLPTEGKKKLAQDLVRRYSGSATALPKEATELSPGDNLLLLASHLLRDASFETKEPQGILASLLEVAVLLEHGLTVSKYSFNIKLALISIYAHLGAIKPCLELYASLEVKHILLDTLTYVILDDTIRLAHFEEAADICEQIQHLHDDNKKNTLEYVIRAFTHEGYSKIREFMDFKEKLARSHQLAVANTELIHLQLRKHDNSPLEAEAYLRSVQLPSVSDEELSRLELNEDYSVIVSWDANENGASSLYSRAATTSAKKLGRSQRDQFAWLKVRGLIPHLLLAAVQGNQSSLAGHLQAFRSVLNELNLVQPKEHDVVSSGSFDQQNYALIVDAFELSALFIEKASVLTGEATEDSTTLQRASELVSHSIKLLDAIGKRVAQGFSLSVDGKEVLNGPALPELVFFVTQTLSWLTLLWQTWVKAIPSGKKKKASEPTVVEIRNLVKSLLNGIRDNLAELDRLLRSQAASGVDLAVVAVKDPFPLGNFGAQESKELPNKVLNSISSSQKASIANLLSAVNAKLNVIKAIRV